MISAASLISSILRGFKVHRYRHVLRMDAGVLLQHSTGRADGQFRRRGRDGDGDVLTWELKRLLYALYRRVKAFVHACEKW